jgi:ATP/maltotriose-dependent transcriptional regulator MalT
METYARAAATGGLGWPGASAAYASALLYNGLGQPEAACDAARRGFEGDHLAYGALIAPEVAEAAARTTDVKLLQTVLDWLTERTQATPNDWLLGIEARIRALLDDGEAADSHYRDSIEHLERTPIRPQLARARLLYEEWLRRQNRRVEAREQLRTAYRMLDVMGLDAFAERARRELLATGESARKRTVETSVELTAQEIQIARLARDGLSNLEIGTRLFLSPRTIEWHLRKVFGKLGITSRRELRGVLPASRGYAQSV